MTNTSQFLGLCDLHRYTNSVTERTHVRIANKTPCASGSEGIMQQVYIYDALRTPFGKLGGGLAGVRPDDLAATVITALLERYPNLDQTKIDDVVFGNANGAGEENRNVARMATLLAGLPTSIPGVTVNRLCGSSLDAIRGAFVSRVSCVGSLDAHCAAGRLSRMASWPTSALWVCADLWSAERALAPLY